MKNKGRRTTMKKQITPLIYLFTIILLSQVIIAPEPTQQYNQIYLNPFYRESMTNNNNYTYTLQVNPPDGISEVKNAIIKFDIYLTPTVSFYLWVNGQACNNPSYQVHTTYMDSGIGSVAFDCSNRINKAGNYTIKLQPSGANTGASNGWLDLTYMNNPAGSLQLSGTEYISGQTGKIFAQLLNSSYLPINNASCLLNMYYPNETILYNNVSMTAVGNDGLYYYDFLAPNTEGLYMLSVSCVTPSLTSNITNTTTQTETFENQNFCSGTGWTDNWIPTASRIYSALIDEPLTDGVAENFISFAGTFTTTIQNGTSWLIKARPSGSINLLKLTMNSQLGTPQSQNLLYNISICRTNATTLTANASLGADCTTPNVLAGANSNLSCYIGSTVSGQSRNIPFITPFTFNTSLNTIINLNAVNEVSGANHFWTIKSDGADTTSAHWRRTLNTTATNYTYIPQIDLYNSGAIISNNTNCIGTNCMVITSGSFHRQFNTAGAKIINITFYSWATGFTQDDQADALFYDGTYHTIYTWEHDVEETNWTKHTIILNSTNYLFGVETGIQFEMNNDSQTGQLLMIDNITITTSTETFYYENATNYQVYRSTNEVHIANTLRDLINAMNTTINNALNQISNQISAETNLTTAQYNNLTNQMTTFQNNMQSNFTNIQNILSTINGQNNLTQAMITNTNLTIHQSITDTQNLINALNTTLLSQFNITNQNLQNNITQLQANITSQINALTSHIDGQYNNLMAILNLIYAQVNLTDSRLINFSIATNQTLQQILTAISTDYNLTAQQMTAIQNYLSSMNSNITNNFGNIQSQLTSMGTIQNLTLSDLLAINTTINQNILNTQSLITNVNQTMITQFGITNTKIDDLQTALSNQLNNLEINISSQLNDIKNTLQQIWVQVNLTDNRLINFTISTNQTLQEILLAINQNYNLTSQEITDISNYLISMNANITQNCGDIQNQLTSISNQQNLTIAQLQAINTTINQNIYDTQTMITSINQTMLYQFNITNTKIDDLQLNLTSQLNNLGINISSQLNQILDYLIIINQTTTETRNLAQQIWDYITSWLNGTINQIEYKLDLLLNASNITLNPITITQTNNAPCITGSNWIIDATVRGNYNQILTNTSVACNITTSLWNTTIMTYNNGGYFEYTQICPVPTTWNYSINCEEI